MKHLFRIFKVSVYDIYRYWRYSGVANKDRRHPSKAALITKYYHMIEKGLALPAPRPGFGQDAIRKLCDLVSSSLADGSCPAETILAIDAIAGYKAFNDSHGAPNPAWIDALLEQARANHICASAEPTRLTCRLGEDDRESHLSFLLHRSSARKFSERDVSDAILEKAARAAQSAPCVCNRQAGRLHFLRRDEHKSAALALQNGNRGFGADASVVAIVTIDLAEFLEVSERYQCWIDGGMFAQNFLLGLHAQGVGACPLNWSVHVGRDRALRRLGHIPESEQVLMMVAIGHVDEKYQVARSHRRPTASIARTHR